MLEEASRRAQPGRRCGAPARRRPVRPRRRSRGCTGSRPGVSAALAGDDAAAVARASELVAASPAIGSRSARCCGRPRAWTRPSARGTIVDALGGAASADDRGRAGGRGGARGGRRRAVAGGVSRADDGGRFAADATRALARLEHRGPDGEGEGEGQGLPAGPAVGPRRRGGGRGAHRADRRRRCGARRELGRRGRRRCATARPTRHAAGPMTLHAAALLAEGRSQTRRRGRCWKPRRSPPRATIRTRCRCQGSARIAEGDGKAELRMSALELAATRFALDQAKIAVAGVESRLARLADEGADGERGGGALASGAGRGPDLLAGGARPAPGRGPARRSRAGGRRDARRRPRACSCPSTGSARCCWRRRSPRRRRAARRGGFRTGDGRWRCCARCWRSIRPTTARSSSCARCWRRREDAPGAGRRRWRRASRSRRIRSR